MHCTDIFTASFSYLSEIKYSTTLTNSVISIANPCTYNEKEQRQNDLKALLMRSTFKSLGFVIFYYYYYFIFCRSYVFTKATNIFNIMKYIQNIKCQNNWIYFKCNLFLWWKAEFSTSLAVFTVTWSFINHFNMLICYSRHFSYNPCWKQLCKLWCTFFRILWWIKSLKEQRLYEIETFVSL